MGDAKAGKFSKAHLGVDPGSIDCVSCHSPHSSKDPAMFRRTVHPPFAARQCDACHLPEKR